MNITHQLEGERIYYSWNTNRVFWKFYKNVSNYQSAMMSIAHVLENTQSQFCDLQAWNEIFDLATHAYLNHINNLLTATLIRNPKRKNTATRML